MFQKLLPVDQNQRVDAALGNEPGRNHRLAKCRGCCQNTRVLREQRLSRCLLIGPQRAMKSHSQRHANVSLITENGFNLESCKRFHDVIQAPSWQREMLRMILGARNDSWLVESRQAHGLRSVEFGILKCGQTQQSVAQPGHELVFGDIDLVSEDYLKIVRKRPGDKRFLSATRWGCRPGIVIILIRQGHAHPDNPSLGFRVAHQSLDLRPAHSPRCGQERPLIGVRSECFVKKNSVAALPGQLLEGQRDQVSEPAFGQCVLIGK